MSILASYLTFLAGLIISVALFAQGSWEECRHVRFNRFCRYFGGIVATFFVASGLIFLHNIVWTILATILGGVLGLFLWVILPACSEPTLTKSTW